jgi:hypothetical protein
MKFKGYGYEAGLVTVNLSERIDQACVITHEAFLLKHDLGHWKLTVVGSHQPIVSVTSIAPDGFGTVGPTEITLIMTFRDELRDLLENHYQQWIESMPE